MRKGKLTQAALDRSVLRVLKGNRRMLSSIRSTDADTEPSETAGKQAGR